MAREDTMAMNNDQGMAVPTEDELTERAIKVLRERSKRSDAPAITSSSTGVMINYARELVRKAS